MAFGAYLGPAAGVGTSVLWTATSLLFTEASRRLGPTLCNAIRIFVAIGLLAITHRLMTGLWFPDARPRQVLFLAASGIVGLVIGDQALLVSFIDIGPRLSVLIMTLSPLVAATLGWLFLDERLSVLACMGIVVTIAGVAWVVLERPPSDGKHSTHRVRGIILAFVGSACQAAGLLLSKQGMGHGLLDEGERMSPLAGTLIRMTFAGMGILPVLAISRLRERKAKTWMPTPPLIGTRRSGLAFALAGSVAGPYLGVWCSLIAADLTDLGVAQTLMSLTPIFILPTVVLIHKERVSRRSVAGAFIAVLGAALLFLTPA